MVNHYRLNTVLYFPNCLREPDTASRIRKDAELTLTASTMTIQIINRSYLLDGDQQQQGEHGPRRGRGRALLGGRGRPGPLGSGGVHGQRADSGRGSPFPSPGRCPTRCRPRLSPPPPATSQAPAPFSNSPRCTTGGLLRHSSRHRAGKCLHKPSPRRAESV